MFFFLVFFFAQNSLKRIDIDFEVRNCGVYLISVLRAKGEKLLMRKQDGKGKMDERKNCSDYLITTLRVVGEKSKQQNRK